MRPLEFALLWMVALDLLRVLHPFFSRRLRSPGFEIITLLIGIVYLVREGIRWQMYPALFMLGMLSGIYWLRNRKGQEERSLSLRHWLLRGILTLITIPLLLLPFLLPVPQLPPPSGPYGVGTMTWHWVDDSRLDPYAPKPGTPREILAQAWYPIDPELEGSENPWMPQANILAPAISRRLNLPPFFLNHLRYASTPAIEKAPPAVSATPFPILLFSHGYGGFRAQNSNQVLHLASHGFFVLAVEHTYGAVITVFPEGQVASHNPNTLPFEASEEELQKAAQALGQQWAGDLAFALQQLWEGGEGEGSNRFQGKLDFSRVAAFGHSTGGGAAIEFCSTSPSCQALLTMDPYMKPVSETTLETGVRAPSLHMFSETWSTGDNQVEFQELIDVSSGDSTVLSIKGTSHYDFTDLPLLSPLAPTLGLKGPLSGARVTQIVNRYTLDFFNQVLLGVKSEILSGPSRGYPEVKFEKRPE